MTIPLYEQLYNHVLESIRTGKFRQGDRVPSEAELAEQFKVSRITSKKALEMLEQNGLISRIRGKGSFVSAGGAPDHAALMHTENGSSAAYQLIGVVVPDFSDAYALKMIHAIEETCAQHHLFIAIKRTYGSQETEKAAIQGLIALGVRGLIVFPVHGEYYNPELLRLVVSGFPVALVDRHLKGIPASAVYTDNVSASRQLTLHLVDRGLQHIAFISPPAENTSTIEERIEGYRAALEARKLVYQPHYVLSTLYSTLPTTFHAENIRRDADALYAFLTNRPQLEAIIASEYNLALLAANVLTTHGLTMPIVCFDSPDMPFAPPLFTHIRQNEALIGQRAVEVLIAHMAGEQAMQTIIVDFEFVQADALASH
ncbi:MAG: GntR family transcriptional regulator [bacterium]|nr:GntR family transcriptional regulator [bacterium]